jgi:hypothetical protein
MTWPFPQTHFGDVRDVFLLFLIPGGGGIPGGVLLAQKYNIAWPVMMLLYFISDWVLAAIFDPVMHFLIRLGRRTQAPILLRMGEVFQKTVQRSIAHFGHSTGPLALILIAFGVDPMTGRLAAASVGHGFLTGWLIAIAGDMIFFTILMASTLWLNSVLGDGTATMLIILGFMIALPIAIRRFRAWRQRTPN